MTKPRVLLTPHFRRMDEIFDVMVVDDLMAVFADGLPTRMQYATPAQRRGLLGS